MSTPSKAVSPLVGVDTYLIEGVGWGTLQCQNKSKPEDTAREESMFRCLEDCKHLIKLECYYVVH